MSLLPVRLSVTCIAVTGLVTAISHADDTPLNGPRLPRPPYAWSAATPLLTARPVDGRSWHAVKDPSIVRYEDRWHLFTTVRGSERSHAVMYASFASWDEANAAPRRILPMHEGYCCAPQVFWFSPHEKWYLICQASREDWGEKPYRAAYSTTTDISDPNSWSPLEPLFTPDSPDERIGLDFWVICDDTQAHLFSTTLNGRMWRRETSRDEFPRGWSRPVLALKDDIFEASHTYRLAGREKYLTLIEAQHGHGWRYFKAYIANRLDGEWTPLAATRDEAFASMRNVQQPSGRWTDNISHGELIRGGFDERLEVEPSKLRFLFQGVSDANRSAKKYGEIPWELGVLEPIHP